MWCVPKLTDEYIARMEDILDLYEKDYDPQEPVLCFDEKSIQLLADIRIGTPTKPGKVRRNDYEYKRNGTRNIFVCVEPRNGFRTTSVTKQRTKKDTARELTRIVTLARYRNARTIHIVLDNLNTHFKTSFIEAFGEQEATRILEKVEFHYTPKHASWLNMAEIEIGVLSGQVLKKRIATVGILAKEVRAWKTRRNKHKASINWTFTSKRAREKFKYGREHI
jgi:hypothetical protein